jgi:hypothetical protein
MQGVRKSISAKHYSNLIKPNNKLEADRRKRKIRPAVLKIGKLQYNTLT